ncbi:hypothetical protein ABTY61_22730 [Kitasatospora sp. NPDC096128]|uniref:hypothetical protein n=1 Tax=Kitasatospora sp. NPDC096128 TaxID=3155547 RepID=UPI003331D6B0
MTHSQTSPPQDTPAPGTTTPPRDPDCTCGWSPTVGRIWCEHCRTDGPQPGTLADPSTAAEPAR